MTRVKVIFGVTLVLKGVPVTVILMLFPAVKKLAASVKLPTPVPIIVVGVVVFVTAAELAVELKWVVDAVRVVPVPPLATGNTPVNVILPEEESVMLPEADIASVPEAFGKV